VRKTIGPFALPCFAYAANGLTPNTVLLLEQSLMNDEMLLRQVVDAMPERVDVLDIPVVEAGGDAWHYLNRQKQWFALFEENREVSFDIDMPDGLQAYLESRSSKFRKKARYRYSKISKDFDVKMEIVPLGEPGVLERLESLSAKTWQEEGGSGLFSEKYARFSNRFLREPCRQNFVAFLSLNGVDVAFNLFQTGEGEFISYKIGFDGSYGAWSPGEVLNHMMYEVLCDDGVRRFMLLGGVTGSKQLWATNTGEMVNYWIFSNKGLKARFVYQALITRRKIKALYEARS
jgi:CelD/BcsL family acetyltransferase involved in cellulose biosynthesis